MQSEGIGDDNWIEVWGGDRVEECRIRVLSRELHGVAIKPQQAASVVLPQATQRSRTTGLFHLHQRRNVPVCHELIRWNGKPLQPALCQADQDL